MFTTVAFQSSSRCTDCLTLIRYRCNGCGSLACVNDDCTGARETAECGCTEEHAMEVR